MILCGKNLDRERILVAEIGNNHEGDPALAMQMVTAAADAGADAVKVQVIDPERLVNKCQVERIEQLSKFRLGMPTLLKMADLARARGIGFLASAFDEDSLLEISRLVDGVKIASGDLDFDQLLIVAAKTGKPVILSTGMGTLDEVRHAVSTVVSHLPEGRSPYDTLALLHCVSLYPVPLPAANLAAIATLHNTFNLTVGYSDHTLGIEAAIVSLAFGARIIEKHFTLDNTKSSFRDHQLSANPEDLRRLSEVLHKYEEIVGDGGKTTSAAELAAAQMARRSIVAARDLEAGTILALEDLAYVRPRNGLPPSASDSLIGRKLRSPLRQHEVLLGSSVE